MKQATVYLKSTSPYSQSRYISQLAFPKKPQELSEDYEERTWRERCNADANGNIYIPAMAFSNNIKQAAKYLSISIPGKGQAKYTKHFESGVLVTEHLTLPVKKDEVDGEWLFVPSDGIRGSGKRVLKCFPLIREWEGEVTYHIYDDIITDDVFARVITAAGQLIGVGRFRPANLGTYGRFSVEDMDFQDIEF